MSNTASNYQLAKLQLGIAITFFAVLTAILASVAEPCRETSTTGIFVTLTLAHGMIMFASSYIEEEQQFWYWMTSSWFAWLTLRRYLRKVKVEKH